MDSERNSLSPKKKPNPSTADAPKAAKSAQKKAAKRARPRPEAKELVGSLVFAIPFLAVTTGNLRNAAAVSASIFIILIPVVVLQFLLDTQLTVPRWVSVPVCTLVALMLASLSYYIIRFVSMEITDALGSYLYLLAAYPVWSAPASEKGVRGMPSAVGWALRYGFRFSCLAVIMGLLREMLAYGQVWGIPLWYSFRAEGAKMTFFGLMLMGLLLAGLAQIRSLIASSRAARKNKAPAGAAASPHEAE